MPFAPICVACAREMRCRKNGYFFKDYQAAAIWSGDLFECEGCKARIVVGVGREPVVESYEEGFDRAASHSEFELRRDKPAVVRVIELPPAAGGRGQGEPPFTRTTFGSNGRN
jgi:hypothetical protein